MGLAIAGWHWSPAQFWSATPHEYQAALAAMQRINRPGGDDASKVGEFQRFREEVEAGERARANA